MESDTERLDWLFKMSADLDFELFTYGRVFRIRYTTKDGTRYSEGETPREAIDAAMKEQEHEL